MFGEQQERRFHGKARHKNTETKEKTTRTR